MREGIGFSVVGTRTVGECEEEATKKQGPVGLMGIKVFGCLDVS